MAVDGWNFGHVKDLLDALSSGVSVNSEDQPANTNEIGVLKVSSVSYGVFLANENKRVIPEEINLVKESPRQSCVIVSRSNTESLVGASAFIERDYPNLFLPDKLWQAVPKKGNVVNQKWLFYFLSSVPIRYRLSKLATGTSGSMKNITKDELLTLPVNIPPILEQQKIAQIISTWDKAIDKLEALIAAKQKRKQALMQRLLTGKIQFSGFNGGWQYLKADELFKPVSKKANGDKEELLAVTQDQGVLPRNLLDRRVVMPDGNTEGYKLVVPGNFIISLRSFQGGLEYSNCRGLVSPAYTVLQPIIKICADFYRHYFKSYDFIGHLAVAVIGIRDGKQISYSDFSFLKLPYPPIEEQQKISAILSAADKEIVTHQKQLAALKQQKKGLMQQLLTGKKRVKTNV